MESRDHSIEDALLQADAIFGRHIHEWNKDTWCTSRQFWEETVFQINWLPHSVRRFALVAGVAFGIQQQVDIFGLDIVLIEQAEIVLVIVVLLPLLMSQLGTSVDAGIKVAQLNIKVVSAILSLSSVLEQGKVEIR